MSSSSQPVDYSDLFTDLQQRVRVQTGQTATEAQSKRYINTGLIDLHIGHGEQLPWAERQAVLRTHAVYDTGTISVNKGSTTITGASTLWNTANDFSENNMRVGGKITIAGSAEVYEISAVASDTSATLNTAFIDDDVSAETYTYFEDEYALASDFLRPFDLQSFDKNGEVRIIGRREFRFMFPRNKTTGRPTVATINDKAFDGDTTRVRKIRFHKPPDAAYLFPYSYVTSNLAVTSAGVEQTQLENDTDEPIVPLQFRHAIVLHALLNWFRDKKNDTRSQEVKQEYTDLLLRIVGDHEIGRSRPQFRPQMTPYARSARKPYRGRGRGGRFVVGDAWDEFRD